MTAEREMLTLKWGTLKAWDFKRQETIDAAKRYAALGWSGSAMSQPNTSAHKAALCELIDIIDADTIGNDWEGTEMTKDEAKSYVMGYGK